MRGYTDLAFSGHLGPEAQRRALLPPPPRPARSVREADAPGPARASRTTGGLQAVARAVDAGVAQMLGEDSIDVREAGRSINERGIAVRSDLDVTVHETVGASVWGYKSPVGQLPTREVREGAALASANG